MKGAGILCCSLIQIYFFLQQGGTVVVAATATVAVAFASSFFTKGQSGVSFNLHSFTSGQAGVPFNGQSSDWLFPPNAKNEPPASIIVAVAIPKNLRFIMFLFKHFVG